MNDFSTDAYYHFNLQNHAPLALFVTVSDLHAKPSMLHIAYSTLLHKLECKITYV